MCRRHRGLPTSVPKPRQDVDDIEQQHFRLQQGVKKVYHHIQQKVCPSTSRSWQVRFSVVVSCQVAVGGPDTRRVQGEARLQAASDGIATLDKLQRKHVKEGEQVLSVWPVQPQLQRKVWLLQADDQAAASGATGRWCSSRPEFRHAETQEKNAENVWPAAKVKLTTYTTGRWNFIEVHHIKGVRP